MHFAGGDRRAPPAHRGAGGSERGAEPTAVPPKNGRGIRIASALKCTSMLRPVAQLLLLAAFALVPVNASALDRAQPQNRVWGQNQRGPVRTGAQHDLTPDTRLGNRSASTTTASGAPLGPKGIPIGNVGVPSLSGGIGGISFSDYAAPSWPGLTTPDSSWDPGAADDLLNGTNQEPWELCAPGLGPLCDDGGGGYEGSSGNPEDSQQPDPPEAQPAAASPTVR